MVALLVVGGRVGIQLAVRQALQQQVGTGLADDTRRGQFRGQGRGLGSPEGVIFRQGQQQEHLQTPVRAAGGVVLLGHVLLRVAVTDGEHTVPVKNGLCQPPVQVAHDDAFHHRQGQRFQPGPDAGRIEGALPDAVGQAAAEGQGRAVCIKPASKLAAELGGTVTVERCAGGVPLGGEHAVQHRVILDGPGVVVVLLGLDACRAIGVPTVAHVPFVHLGHIGGGLLHIAGHAHRIQRQIDQYAEEQPVAAGQFVVVDGVQPLGKVGFPGIGQGCPDVFRCFQNGTGQGGHLDKQLVVIVGGAPVFGALRVGAVGKTLLVDGQKVIGPAAACPQGA